MYSESSQMNLILDGSKGTIISYRLDHRDRDRDRDRDIEFRWLCGLFDGYWDLFPQA
jgi:hypothetical protein